MNCFLMDLPAQTLTCLQLLQPGRQNTSTLSSATVRYFPQELQTKMSKKDPVSGRFISQVGFFSFYLFIVKSNSLPLQVAPFTIPFFAVPELFFLAVKIAVGSARSPWARTRESVLHRSLFITANGCGN